MKKASKTAPAKDVDEYIAMTQKDARATLGELRRVIKATAPKASEVISYRIPVYKYHGMLVGFSASKDHCGFHLMSKALMAVHREELKAYGTAIATIHFPYDRPVPVALVRRLVKARMKDNEARLASK